MSDDNLAATLDNNPFETARELPPRRTRDWAEKLAAAYSLEKQAVLRRSGYFSLYETMRPTTRVNLSLEKNASTAEELAKAYALYKLAFLQTISETDKDFDLTCDLAVRQNYV